MSKPTIKNNMLHWTFPTSTSCSFWGLCHILISRCDDRGETLITTLWEQHQINRRGNGPSSKNDKYSFMACCQGVGVFVCQSRGGGGSEVNSRTMTTPKQSPLVNMSSYFCPDWRFNKKRGVDGCWWARNNETGVIKTGLQDFTVSAVKVKHSLKSLQSEAWWTRPGQVHSHTVGHQARWPREVNTRSVNTNRNTSLTTGRRWTNPGRVRDEGKSGRAVCWALGGNPRVFLFFLSLCVLGSHSRNSINVT